MRRRPRASGSTRPPLLDARLLRHSSRLFRPAGAEGERYIRLRPCEERAASHCRESSIYSETAAGWDLKTAPKIANGACSSDKPYFFSIAVPEGNYRVE